MNSVIKNLCFVCMGVWAMDVHASLVHKESGMEPKKDMGFDASVQKNTGSLKGEDFNQAPISFLDAVASSEFEVFVEARLNEEIDIAEKLLQLESSCAETAPMGMRLADLYWEKSKRSFFKSQAQEVKEAEKQRHLKDMKQAQDISLKHYGKIVEECPLYEDIAKVFFYKAKALVELDRFSEAVPLFQKIVDSGVGSEWVPQSWFMLGEYRFNEKADVVGALKAYTKASLVDGPVYGFALYKKGWCYVNAGEWPLALEYFKKVIQLGQNKSADARMRVMLRKEALKDYVRAYAHTGTPDKAWRDFSALASEDEVVGMMEHLGQWYVGQGAHHKVVLVYQVLLSKKPQSVKKIMYDTWVLDAVGRMGSSKSVLAYVHQVEKDKKAMAWPLKPSEEEVRIAQESERFLESTLRRMAVDYHKEAKKLRGSSQALAYGMAEEMYRVYLSLYGNAQDTGDVYYPFYMHFYYAEVLYRAGRFKEASEHYGRVVGLREKASDKAQKELVVAAAEEQVRALDVLVQEEERVHPERASGENISDVRKQLIEACVLYVAAVGDKGERYTEMVYKMARIYYSHQHYKEAMPWFKWLVTERPQHALACYAAHLILDVYNGQKAYLLLQKEAQSYAQNTALSCGAEDREKFKTIEMQASFQFVKEQFEEKREYAQAAKAYEDFYARYPLSVYADDALYNASVNHVLAKKFDDAYRVKVFLVQTFPQSPLTAETLLEIARILDQKLDLQKASDFLEQFVALYPSKPETKNAVYNAFLYRRALGDTKNALKNASFFLRAYPSDKDVFWLRLALCESYELSQKHTCESGVFADAYASSAYAPMCEALQKRVYAQDFVKAPSMVGWGKVRVWWNGLSEEQKKSHPVCAHAWAEWDMRTVRQSVWMYKTVAIAEINPTDKGKKIFEQSLKKKIQLRDKLVGELKAVLLYGSVEHSTEALYLIGEVYHDMVEKLLQAPVPRAIEGYVLQEDDKKALRAQLKETSAPVHDLELEAYQLCVEQSRVWHVRNTFTEASLKALSGQGVLGWKSPRERFPVLSDVEPVALPVPGPLVLDGGYVRALLMMEKRP